VLDEEVEQAGFVGLNFGEFLEDVVGDEVGAAGARGEDEGFLEPVVSWLASGFVMFPTLAGCA
jgi:hypothetical protein